MFTFFLTAWGKTGSLDTRFCFNIRFCTFNLLCWLAAVCVCFSLSWWGWWEGRWSWLNLSPADLPLVSRCLVSHHHHLSAQRIFKVFSLHFASEANAFLMLPLPLPSRRTTKPNLPISSRKTKAVKQDNEGISFGRAFWAFHSHGCRFVRFETPLLDSLTTAATSSWIS